MENETPEQAERRRAILRGAHAWYRDDAKRWAHDDGYFGTSWADAANIPLFEGSQVCTCACIMGAISLFTGGLSTSEFNRMERFMCALVHPRLDDPLRYDTGEPAWIGAIYTWNDDPKRKFEDVTALLQEAATI